MGAAITLSFKVYNLNTFLKRILTWLSSLVILFLYLNLYLLDLYDSRVMNIK
ncbi:1923_t:CDS:2 [Dentiscutata heterogama]|uniref:1923_t:CDS:1 n=1 Tax=Dentiscutata heterogama TaxID=1316150 RepID=A0ACA9K6K8_9GLOM|nr:1923_t:CDS:2 [Dentiscutata heterogama]